MAILSAVLSDSCGMLQALVLGFLPYFILSSLLSSSNLISTVPVLINMHLAFAYAHILTSELTCLTAYLSFPLG